VFSVVKRLLLLALRYQCREHRAGPTTGEAITPAVFVLFDLAQIYTIRAAAGLGAGGPFFCHVEFRA